MAEINENNAAAAIFTPRKESMLREHNSVMVEKENLLDAFEKKSKGLQNIKAELKNLSEVLVRDIYRQSDRDSRYLRLRRALLLWPLSVFGETAYGAVLLISALLLFMVTYSFLPIYAVAVISLFYWMRLSERKAIKKELSEINYGGNIFFIYFHEIVPNTNQLLGYIGTSEHARDIDERSWELNKSKEVVGKVCLELQGDSGNSLLLWYLSGGNAKGETLWWDGNNPFLKNFGGYYEKALEKTEMAIAKAASEFKEIVILKIEISRIQQKINTIAAEISSFENRAKIWNDVILPNDVVQYILKRIVLFDQRDAAAPKGLLLFGPPGTGKTFLAKAIAQSTSSCFLEIKPPDLKSDHIGGSGRLVKSIWEEARRHEKTIIFVDECEGVFGRRGSVDSDQFTNEIVQAFLPEWDGMSSGGNIWVIGATNRKELIDPAIVSRFGAEIEIPLPKEAERALILRKEFSKLGVDAALPDYIGKITAGMSGRDLASLARDVKTEAHPCAPNEGHFNQVSEKIKKKGGTIVSSESTWDTLVLPERIKVQLQDSCLTLQNAEILKRQGLPIPRGILLYGPPGTGKTEIARTIANESRLQFIAASTAEVKGAYIGHSGKNVKELFDRARSSSPAILFIDEIESIVPTRNGRGDAFTGEIVTQMLQELDGIKSSSADVFLIAATNHRDMMDAAILSRFSSQIEIPLPDFEARLKMFELKLGGVPLSFDVKVMCHELAIGSEGYSGRDIHDYVQASKQRAAMRAIRNNTQDKVVIERGDFQVFSS